MTHDEILQGLYDHTLVGHAPEVTDLVNQGLADGPEAALDIVDRLALEDYRYLHATRGELLRRLGRAGEARDAYRRALELVHDDAERRLLERRLAELAQPPPAPGV